ncbi:hypothetical protein F5Y06DRAFT_218147 [Hypoxylon sp. FL0890]|nr:hypothetical protein F5Y06DRAFT_218147 [Hypoxylon sp. FL0890]
MTIDEAGRYVSADADTVVSATGDYRFWNTRMNMDAKEDDEEADKLSVKRRDEEAEEQIEMGEKEGGVKIKNGRTDYDEYSSHNSHNSDVDGQIPKRHKANHHHTINDVLQRQATNGTSSGTPASPERDEELEHIVAHIDQKHCDKYKWYIERHLRTIFLPNAQPSRQLYYRRVMQTHYTKKNHSTEQIHAGPRNKERYEVKKMRPSAFPRIDYEAALAQYTARQTSQSLAWATSTKRVPADKLGAVLHEAVKAYGWPEVVTDANVDEILKRDGIRDLDAFDKHQRNLTAATPATNGLSSKKTPEFRLGSMATDNQDVHEHESQPRQSIVLQQTSRLGSILNSKPNQLSIKPPYLPESMSQHNAEEKTRFNNQMPKDKRERRERRIRLRRLQEQKIASLEKLRLDFEEDMNRLFAEYNRRRSQIETEFSEMMNSEG